MASYNITIADSIFKTNKISFTIPANTGKSYKVKVDAPAGVYGTWYYNSTSTAKSYTISIDVVYFSKIRVTVSESNDSNAEVKIYTPLCGVTTQVEEIEDPKLTSLNRGISIALSVPTILTAVASQFSLKKTAAAANTVAYTFTYVATAIIAFKIIFNVAESVSDIATVTTKFNVTTSMIYITVTTKFADGTSKSDTNQTIMPGF